MKAEVKRMLRKIIYTLKNGGYSPVTLNWRVCNV